MTVKQGGETESVDTLPVSDAESQGYVLGGQVGFLLRKAQQRHLAIFTATIGEDLTPMQFAALAKLYEVGPSSQNSLGRQTAMDVATIKGVVSRLKARELVDKTGSPDDRRMHLVALTPSGRAMVERLFSTAVEISERTLEPLTAKEKADFMRLLTKLT